MPYINLVGYLVGCLLPESHPLIISLYAQPDGRHSIRVSQETAITDPAKAATRLGFLMEPVLLKVWRNTSTPAWYYLQFDKGHGPDSLHLWDAPWSVYTDWRGRYERG